MFARIERMTGLSASLWIIVTAVIYGFAMATWYYGILPGNVGLIIALTCALVGQLIVFLGPLSLRRFLSWINVALWVAGVLFLLFFPIPRPMGGANLTWSGVAVSPTVVVAPQVTTVTTATTTAPAIAVAPTSPVVSYNFYLGFWGWFIVLALAIILIALIAGYRFSFGSTDSTKADVELRIKKKGDLRFAIGVFVWLKNDEGLALPNLVVVAPVCLLIFAMWWWPFALGALAIILIALIAGYRFSFGSTDSTKPDLELRIKKGGELRFAIGTFVWRRKR